MFIYIWMIMSLVIGVFVAWLTKRAIERAYEDGIQMGKLQANIENTDRMLNLLNKGC